MDSEVLNTLSEIVIAMPNRAHGLVDRCESLETLIQHNQGDNPPDFDYAFNLAYGRPYTREPALIAELRRMVDADTRARAAKRAPRSDVFK